LLSRAAIVRYLQLRSQLGFAGAAAAPGGRADRGPRHNLGGLDRRG
jgi:hypothetical protein